MDLKILEKSLKHVKFGSKLSDEMVAKLYDYLNSNHLSDVMAIQKLLLFLQEIGLPATGLMVSSLDVKALMNAKVMDSYKVPGGTMKDFIRRDWKEDKAIKKNPEKEIVVYDLHPDFLNDMQDIFEVLKVKNEDVLSLINDIGLIFESMTEEKANVQYHCLLAELKDCEPNLEEEFFKLQSSLSLNEVQSIHPHKPDATNGLETDPHVTVLYGLVNGSDFDEVAKVCKEFGKIEFEIGNISAFRNADKPYDVLKLAVISDDLKRLHYLLRERFENNCQFDYNAHITLAYVNSGAFKGLEGPCELTGKKLICNKLVFSDTNDGYKYINVSVGKDEENSDVKKLHGALKVESECGINDVLENELWKSTERFTNFLPVKMACKSTLNLWESKEQKFSLSTLNQFSVLNQKTALQEIHQYFLSNSLSDSEKQSLIRELKSGETKYLKIVSGISVDRQSGFVSFRASFKSTKGFSDDPSNFRIEFDAYCYPDVSDFIYLTFLRIGPRKEFYHQSEEVDSMKSFLAEMEKHFSILFDEDAAGDWKSKGSFFEGKNDFRSFKDPWAKMSPDDRKEANRLQILALKAYPSSPKQIELRNKLNAILKKYNIGSKVSANKSGDGPIENDNLSSVKSRAAKILREKTPQYVFGKEYSSDFQHTYKGSDKSIHDLGKHRSGHAYGNLEMRMKLYLERFGEPDFFHLVSRVPSYGVISAVYAEVGKDMILLWKYVNIRQDYAWKLFERQAYAAGYSMKEMDKGSLRDYHGYWLDDKEKDVDMKDAIEEAKKSLIDLEKLVESEDEEMDFFQHLDDEAVMKFADGLLTVVGELEAAGKIKKFKKPSDARAALLAAVRKLYQSRGLIGQEARKYQRFGNERVLRSAKREIQKAQTHKHESMNEDVQPMMSEIPMSVATYNLKGDVEVLTKQMKLKWTAHDEWRSYGLKSLSPVVGEQKLEIEYMVFDDAKDDYGPSQTVELSLPADLDSEFKAAEDATDVRLYPSEASIELDGDIKDPSTLKIGAMTVIWSV